jgi:hypothetical protein
VIVSVAADTGCDLIVMGTHGRQGVSRVLMGSVAEHVIRNAPCPVLTTRGLTTEAVESPEKRSTDEVAFPQAQPATVAPVT